MLKPWVVTSLWMGLHTIVDPSTVDGSSTSKNRPSHYKYKSPKQFEVKQLKGSKRTLNVRWALPVYLVFEDEKSKASDGKSFE